DMSLFSEFGASRRVIERAWQLYQELCDEGFGRRGHGQDRFPSRFARAGESGDCGHERRGGAFTRGNTCAAGGGAREIPRDRSSPESIDDASGASRWIGELPPEVGPVHAGHCPPSVTLKKNGSIEMGTRVRLSRARSRFLVKSAFLWYTTSCG